MRRAPTASMDSGQMSRTSRTKGRRLSRAAHTPAHPQKNWGDVATMTSGLGARPAAQMALTTGSHGLIVGPVWPNIDSVFRVTGGGWAQGQALSSFPTDAASGGLA